MNLDSFKVARFPEECKTLAQRGAGYVYVFCVFSHNGEVPFYVGQTRRLRDRMGDYESRSFYACTDFIVGTAAEYFRQLGLQVLIRYTESETPRLMERALIRDLVVDGWRLLNGLPKYDYSDKRNTKESESTVVKAFCDMLVHRRTKAASL